MLELLAGLAEEAGIAVRTHAAGDERAAAASGVCRVRGQPAARGLAPPTRSSARIEAVVAALRAHGADWLEGRFLPPAVRERLDRPPRPAGFSLTAPSAGV